MEPKGSNSSEHVQQDSRKIYRCPTCDKGLKSCEVKSHCEQEVIRLLKGQNNVNDNLIKNVENHALNNDVETCLWSIFEKVRKNRQSRSEMKSRKRLPADTQCPFCNIQVTRFETDHMDKCLKSNKQRINAISEVVFENAEDFEEYEWAGQKRIRVSSLLRGGYAAIGIGTNINRKENQEDEDLNVDEDDSKIYGPPQYNDNHLIAPECVKNESIDNCYINFYLRQLSYDEINCGSCTTLLEEKSDNIEGLTRLGKCNDESTVHLQNNVQHIIDSLKSKLRKWENHSRNKFKCLICLDEYHNPVISVSCWHVHCEECWLKSLGTRKLCPQCNLITSPSDLRRIYM